MADIPTSDELAEASTEELIEQYNEAVEKGVDRGARRMSIGPAVMEASPIKRELRDRGVDLDEV